MKSIKQIYIENAYGIFIFCIICLYWLYSIDMFYTGFIELNTPIYQIIIVVSFYSIVITGIIINAYYTTKDKVINKLNNIYNEDVINNV